MKTIRVEDVADVFNGKTPSKSEQRVEGKPVLKIRDIDEDGDFNGSFGSFVDENFYKKHSNKKLKFGDTIILNAAHNTNYVGNKNAIIDAKLDGIIATGEWLIVRPRQIDSNFLNFYLKSFEGKQKIRNEVKGIHLYPRDVKRIKIPIPSTDDQTRIAILLSKVESLIAKRKKSIADLDELLKNTFLEMFGDPLRNEMGWEKKTAIDYSDCIVPGRDKPKSFSGHIPWVTTNDIEHLGYTEKAKNNLGLNEKEILRVKAKRIPKDSVVLVCAGDLGRVTILKQEVVINQQLHSFQVNSDMNNRFFMFALSFQKEFMYRRATKTTIPYMNKTVCNSIPVINPPSNLQSQFAVIVEKVEAIKGKCQTSLNDIEALYSALSQKAFKGELDLSRIPLAVDLKAKDITTGKPRVGEPTLFVQDEPDKAPESREQTLRRLFNAFLSGTKNKPISLDEFWLDAEEKVLDLLDEDAPPMGIEDYDRVRDWLFDMLAQGKVAQVFNAQENRMELLSVS